MVYNSLTESTLLFGGMTDAAVDVSVGDLWQWDGDAWTERYTGAGKPPSRGVTAAAMDTYRGVFVVFSGIEKYDTTVLLHDTWEWRASIGPADAMTCRTATASFSVEAVGDGPFGYQWQYEALPIGSGEWIALADGTLAGSAAEVVGSESSELVLINTDAASQRRFRCMITDACNYSYSPAAVLTVCPADFDCSGQVDLDDYGAFVAAFEAGDETSDVDESGFVDLDDFAAFVAMFEIGC